MNKTEVLMMGVNYDPGEVVALFKLKRINKEDMSPDNQTMLDIYMGQYLDDKEFAGEVISRMGEINKGIRLPLFEPELTDKKPKGNQKKTKSKNTEKGLQMPLWDYEILNGGKSGLEGTWKPKDKIHGLGNDLNRRFYFHNNEVMREEVSKRKMELRNEIGLPEVRGADKRVGDRFYKYLVKRIYTYDVFKIFAENDRVLVEADDELELKKEMIKEEVERISELNVSIWHKMRKFKEFKKNFAERWGLGEI